jgi:hypothetical protein
LNDCSSRAAKGYQKIPQLELFRGLSNYDKVLQAYFRKNKSTKCYLAELKQHQNLYSDQID